jgi:diguanylate cyclase
MEQANGEQWKSKYAELVKENSEQQQHIDILRHTVTRLGSAANGQDFELDGHLERLRYVMRHNQMSREFLAVIKDIDKSAKGVDDRQQVAIERWRELYLTLFESLRERLPPHCWPGLIELREHANSLQNLSDCLQLHERLLDVASQSAVKSDEHAPGMHCRNNLDAEQEPPFSAIGAKIQPILQELVTLIPVPDSAKATQQRLQQVINTGLNWYELVATLEELSLMLVASFYAAEGEFTHFLQQTLERLAQVEASLGLSQQMVGAETSALQELSSTAEKLRQGLDDDQDIDHLKEAIKERLDHIDGFIAHQDEVSTHGSTAMAEQLQAMQELVGNLQNDVREAHLRLEEQRKKAETDPLTQLPNREAYEKRAELEFKRWQRYRRPLSLVVGDIDFFKSINDNYGHLAGDKVLQIVARQLRERLRQTDFIARYGGEEMVILLPETSVQQALQTAENLRRQLEAANFHYNDDPVLVTMSFGIAEFCEGDTVESVFTRADKAMYRSKDEGRNRCSVE